MIVMKFGGTSVGTAESIRQACALVKTRIEKKPVVVVSAHNSPSCRMTDTLIDSADKALAGEPDASRVIGLQLGIIKDLGLEDELVMPLLNRFSDLLTGISMIGEISPKTMDMVMSFGERMSCRVFGEVMRKEFGVNMADATSFDLGLETDGVHGSATPDDESFATIKKNITDLNADAVVVTGFLAKGPDGHITTLGRGGSDFSATIFGAAVAADEVEIWTDVSGVMTADPKIAKDATSISELSYREASELAWYGAKVLHPSTMVPAIKYGIPVRVLNTMEPEHPGTVILPKLTRESGVAKSVVYKKDISLVTISSSRMLGMHGFMARVFQIFSDHMIDIHMIATSEVSVSLTVPGDAPLDAAVEELSLIGDVDVEHDKAIVCVIGEDMAGTPGVASRVTGSLARVGVNIHMISQGACELNIALLVASSDVTETVGALHDEFFQ